ncbi:hypothetical protein JCM17846_15830 [Iodidimonas nitroreducens]|uniref:Outer membrane protein beta-barrel domain-containing protein n=1 Tax=Iodidimonas nitroreducens TaxID=1236968 RepID=A0A5A7N6H0_9PROT|nr:TorF family putative porin [Iodidimonas nitroreducens]GAK33976.1 bacterial protein of unknown function [alpha proteobacterium Q-1]GER03901.1 hypothetical protein JCM17846_15830 [Iodidimonas nitroreducens]
MRGAGLKLLACFGLIGLLAPMAKAQDVKMSMDAAVMSDLVDRGLSLSDEDPSASFGIFADLGRHLYSGLTVASIDDFMGNDARISGIVGLSLPLDAYQLDLSVLADGFVGGDGFVTPEIRARLSRDLGLFVAAAGVSYAPDGRWSLRNQDVLYSYLETEVPIPRLSWLTAVAHVGYELFDGAANKTDWGMGLAAGYQAFEFSLNYEDSDRNDPRGDARLVAALRVFF